MPGRDTTRCRRNLHPAADQSTSVIPEAKTVGMCADSGRVQSPETDGTLFFDFLPQDLDTVRGFGTRFLYIVPRDKSL